MLDDVRKEIIVFYSAAVKTASEDGTSWLIHPHEEGVLTVDVTAVSGTSPTLVIAVETSEDGTTWFHNTIVADKDRQGDLVRLTAPTIEAKITTVSKHVAWLMNLSRYVRLVLTIAGTTPSFTITAKGSFYA